MPTRNAYVPVPPARPVVSVSRNRRRRTPPEGAPCRVSTPSSEGAALKALSKAVTPCRCSSAYSRRTETIGPCSVSSRAPPTSVSIGSDAGREGRDWSMRRTIRRSSSSVFIDRRSGAERREDRRGGQLRPAADLVHGPDTRGAARPAPAGRQDFEAPREQLREHLE